MTSKHVISVDAFGEVQHTLKDSVLKLPIGTRLVHRVSEIKHDYDTDHFVIRWLRGPYKATFIHSGLHYRQIAEELYVSYTDAIQEVRTASFDPLLLFPTYEDAVAHEVACLNAMRLRGIRF